MCATADSTTPKQAFSLADWYNDITHRPYIYELTHAIEWTVNLALAPLLIVGLWVKLFCELFTTAGWFPEDPKGRGAILVTGCDTGFGRRLVVDLAARGWKVSHTLAGPQRSCMGGEAGRTALGGCRFDSVRFIRASVLCVFP